MALATTAPAAQRPGWSGPLPSSRCRLAWANSEARVSSTAADRPASASHRASDVSHRRRGRVTAESAPAPGDETALESAEARPDTPEAVSHGPNSPPTPPEHGSPPTCASTATDPARERRRRAKPPATHGAGSPDQTRPFAATDTERPGRLPPTRRPTQPDSPNRRRRGQTRAGLAGPPRAGPPGVSRGPTGPTDTSRPPRRGPCEQGSHADIESVAAGPPTRARRVTEACSAGCSSARARAAAGVASIAETDASHGDGSRSNSSQTAPITPLATGTAASHVDAVGGARSVAVIVSTWRTTKPTTSANGLARRWKPPYGEGATSPP